MSKFFVYILESGDGRYYTGYTTDIERRFRQHQAGEGARFTKAFGAAKLVFQEEHLTKSDALKREAAIKKLSRTEKLALIDGNPSSCHFKKD